jgi:hypothetical protein
MTRELHLFHASCPKMEGPHPAFFVLQPRGEADWALNQAVFKCERCGTLIHVDCWPLERQPDPPFDAWVRS